MKSFTRFLFLTVLLLTSFLGTKAQVSLYTFSSSAGTYSEVSGGSVLHSGTADDALATGSIGFTFKYNGVNYTSIKVNTNGWASFGTTTSTTTYTPLSSTGTHNPCLSPLGRDLQGNTNGSVRIETIGTAPNRICVIQWKDWRRYAGTQNFNFQIRLYETTDVVQFVYGTMTASTSSSDYDCGITGNTNADYNIRTSSTSWSASTAGTANTANMTISNTIFPVSGQTYTWTPPPFPELSAVSVSPAISCTTTNPRQVQLNASISSGSISSVVLNYSFNGVAQTPITMTNTSGTTYSATIPAATPVNATVTWSVLATSAIGTSSSLNGTSYQDQPWFGVSANAIANQSTICAGATASLSMVTSNTPTEVVTQNTSTPYFTTFSYGNPFYHTTYGGLKTQHMYKASELTAAGVAAGSITNLSLIVGTTFGMTYNNFAISMGQTMETQMSGINSAISFSPVYSTAALTTVSGANNFNFSSPFVWDGVSNIVVQFCWSNNNPGGTANNSWVVSPGFTCTAYYGADNETATQICGATTTTGTSTVRPVLTFTGNKIVSAQSFNWYSQGSSTSVATTNPGTVTVPATTDFYGVATITGCDLTSSNVTVNTLALPATPIATNSTQCGTGIPTASVASAAGAAGTGNYIWYDAATNGNIVQNSSWLTQYQDNFAGSTVATNGLLTGVANLTASAGWLQLTPATNSQQGGLTVQPGVNGIEYKIDFDYKSNTAFGADGFSWSFAPDADATLSIGSPKAESGTGSKLKISFDAYGSTMPNQKGTYVVYNNTDTTFTNTSAGVLAFTANTPWLSTTSKHITITISQAGNLNMSVDGIPVFTNIALPASYLTENKSTWKHVFAARTGGVNMTNEIDNLLIQYKLTPVGSSTFNSSLSSGVTYYVTELGANGCYSQLAPVVIGVSQPAPITFANSAAAICIGESVTLNMSSTITPPYTYTISSPNTGAGVGTTATGATQTFTPTASGSMPYIVTATNGNCTEVDTVNITVVPSASPAPIIAMDTLNLCPSATSASFTASASSMMVPHTFNLFDSYGDGWNGNVLKVLINGVLAQSLTFTTGTSFSATVNVPEGSVLSTQWTTGSFLSECSFNIVRNGSTIHTATGLTTANLSTKMYTGTVPSYSYTFSWYSAATGGTLLGTGATLEALGTSVLPNLNTVGQYIVYAKQSNACLSAATPAVVNVTNVLAAINPINASCNSVANGSFSVGTITCGTTPFTFSVDGGAFGAIPTNLAYGNHIVVVKDATGAVAPAVTIFIDQPTWITNVPNFVANGWACKDETSEFISAANPNLQQTNTISLGSVNIGGNGVATLNPALNLPVGAVITGATLNLTGMTTSGGTWANDLIVVASGLGSTNQVPTGNTVTNANYSYPLTSINPNGTSINVVITNTWGSGSAVINNVSLVVSYTINQTLSNITWHNAATGGAQVGSGFQLQTVGTSVLPNTSTPGVYNFYAQGELNGCSSFTRQLVTVTIQAPTIVANMQTATVCPGNFLTLNATGGLTYTWSNGAGQNTPFVPAPTAYVGGTQSYVVNGYDVDGCANQDTVIVTVLPQPILNGGVDQAVCAGIPVILNASTTAATATAVTSYVWSNGIVNNTQYVPTVSGPLTVTATGANGCTTQDQVNITVLALPTVNAGTDQTICLGMGTSLSATGALTYAWNNGVSQGMTFYPTASQTYTVVGTGSNGCTNTDQVIVNIQTLPQVVATSSTQVCSNAVATLNAAVQNSLGGYWTTTNGFGVISPNVSNANASYAPSTNDPAVVNFTYIANNACGSSSQNTSLVILPIPSVNAGSDFAICQGEAATLNATGTGSLTWTTPNVSNGVAFIPNSTATYNVVATGANNCTNNDQVTVTVLALPDVDAGSDVTICSGESIALTAAGANAYSWDGGVSNGVLFTPTSTSTYSVTGTAINGCTATDQVLVTVNATPVATIALTGLSTLEASPSGMNYQWVNCNSGTDVPNASFQTFVAQVNGSYAVIVTSAEGCSSQSNCEIVDQLSIEEQNAIVMSVQPNPTTGELNISMPTDLSATAQVFDAQGKLVIDLTNVSNGSILNLTNMTTGVYMIRITAADSVQTFRVVKQ